MSAERKLREPLQGQTGWLRLTPLGGLEIELYDYSSDAESWFGHDVAWVWTVETLEKLWEHLPERARYSSEALFDALTEVAPDARGLVRWLREKGAPVAEKFDSWA